MAENESWMEPFRAKEWKNVWVLHVSIMEEGQPVKCIREVVDCLRGEAGVWYARNLLCRLANEAVRGTKLETCPWREARMLGGGAGKAYLYRKVKDPENYARAEMEWYESY